LRSSKLQNVLLNLHHSEKTMSEIFKALAKAQKNFEAALKGAQNPHFRSKYAALDSCVDAVRGPLNDCGVFLTQTIESVESGVLIETIFAHESGEVYSGGKLFMPVVKQDAQGYGSAITYGRRYSLLTACGVAPEDDDGNEATKAKPEKVIHTPTGTPLIEPSRMSIIVDVAEAVKEHMQSSDITGAYEESCGITDEEERIALWRLLDSKTRSALKACSTQLKEAA
jgi:hypothetical protein